MPVMQIFRAGKKIGTEEFSNNFFVLEVDGRLFWGQEEKLEVPISKGQALVWIRGLPLFPNLAYLLPDWHLFLDGVEVERNPITTSVEIDGNMVLEYQDYRFVCFIPKGDQKQ